MNIVGLGKAGCSIADALSQYPQYTVYKIDAGASHQEVAGASRVFYIPEQGDPEKYEESVPLMETFFRGISGEVVFVVSGGAKVAGACLAILEQIKHCKITILYIKPNLSTLDSAKATMQHVCFGVLQEYARSAVFERFIAIDNDVVEAILGDVPIIGYYDKLNELIVWAFHTYNVLRHTEPVMGKVNETKVTCRISTLGTVDLESGEEKLFFPLDKVREKSYYYVLKNEDLISSGKLLKKINEQVKNLTEESARGSYAIYSSEYNKNFILCAAHTPHIQPAQE